MAANRLYRVISVFVCLIILFGSLCVLGSSDKTRDIYLVRFLNSDGSLLYETIVHKGASAVYCKEEPTLPETEEYKYYFSGWDKSVDNIECDTVLRATYDKVKRIYYTVKFLDWDGKILQSVRTEKGKDAQYTLPPPKREPDLFNDYEFAGWDKSCCNIQCDLNINALYEKIKPAFSNNDADIKNDVFTPRRITVNNSEFTLSADLSDRLTKALNNTYSKRAGFYVIDCETNMTIGYNANMSFPAASTVKAAMALYACSLADKGEVSLDDKYVYKKRHLCYGSGIIQHEEFGKEYTLGELLHLMIYYSDNVAYYMIQDYLGYRGYNDYISGLGLTHKHKSYNDWGIITPHELGLLWQEIYRYRSENANGELIFKEFLCSQYDFTKTALNKYKNIAHKSGYNDLSYHDAGVVFGDRRYILVLLTTPRTKDDHDKNYFTSIVRLLDEAMSEYKVWLETHQY